MNGEQLTFPEETLDKEIEMASEGVSVSLNDRARALARLAAAYAGYARANGMVTALDSPEHRNEMERRYEDPYTVAAIALQKAIGRLRDSERQQAEVLVNAPAFAAFGMHVSGIETLMQQTTIEARHAIGVDVGSEQRHAVLNGLYTPKG